MFINYCSDNKPERHKCLPLNSQNSPTAVKAILRNIYEFVTKINISFKMQNICREKLMLQMHKGICSITVSGLQIIFIASAEQVAHLTEKFMALLNEIQIYKFHPEATLFTMNAHNMLLTERSQTMLQGFCSFGH